MKIAIAGYGLEGKASYRYYRDQGHQVTIVDEREISAQDLPYGASALTGPGALEELAGFELVIRSPGVAPSKLKTDGKVWSASNEFFSQVKTDVIGVTGTKGKGTTASLIDSILRSAGLKTALVGNIGRPALEVLDEANQADVVIYELSSFQLWDLESSPGTAVVLMIEADHLDVHADLDDYVAAKSNICRHQGSQAKVYYHPTNQYSQRIAKSGAGEAKRYGIAEDGAAYVDKNTFFIQGQAICPTDALQLPGVHNLDNACAAISAAWNWTTDGRAIERGLKNFKGLEHRLKLIAEVDGVKYYDDSIATTPGSAIAALNSFSESKVIILGGSDKGADYGEVVAACRQTGSQVIAIGQTGQVIAELCAQQGVPVEELGRADMDDIVETARQLAKPGSVVILSPAAASFDMFSSYAERGERFEAAVKALRPAGG